MSNTGRKLDKYSSRTSLEESSMTPKEDIGDFNIQTGDYYERLAQVGEGTYGKVYKARYRDTNRLYALKRIKIETEKEGFPLTAMREIRFLQRLNHPNILSLVDIVSTNSCIYMVFDYMDFDLTGLLNHPNFVFNPEHIKCIINQILEGLAHLHANGIIHRDIKGSNILLSRRGIIKLADFGLAKNYVIGADYTNRVITIWYRPPELLLGSTSYSFSVDMWGIGCILIELFSKKPIFTGVDEVTQLQAIFKVKGSNIESEFPEVVQLPWYSFMRPKERYKDTLKEKIRNVSPETEKLIVDLLHYNPSKRIPADEALRSAYFSEEPKPCDPRDIPMPIDDWHEFEAKKKKREMKENPPIG